MDSNTIENLRKIKKLTQRQVADALGITVTGYQKMISVNDPKISVLKKLSELFGVEITTFVVDAKIEVAEPHIGYKKSSKKFTYKLSELEVLNISPLTGEITIVLKS